MTSNTFTALFPPLFDSSLSTDTSVDVSVDDLYLPTLEQCVESHIENALKQWDTDVPVETDAGMVYMERLHHYQGIARRMLYNQEDDTDEEDSTSWKRRKKQQETTKFKSNKLTRRKRLLREAEIAQYRAIFESLPSIRTLREERKPSERLQAFMCRYPMHKRLLQQKRSFADTKTYLSFDFARTKAEAQSKTRSVLSPKSVYPLVLWLDVLHPTKDPSRTQSFLVLNTQRMIDLLDLIVCENDMRLMDHSKPSKLLYHDQQFYIDQRMGTIDYSQEIRTWISASQTRIDKYGDPKQMILQCLETSTFEAWTLQVDQPSVYIHQGECEHMIRLRDARVYDPTIDTQDMTQFPMRLVSHRMEQSTKPSKKCMICQQYNAKWITYGDVLSVADPMFYCQRCYQTAHSNGLNQFTTYPFIQ